MYIGQTGGAITVITVTATVTLDSRSSSTREHAAPNNQLVSKGPLSEHWFLSVKPYELRGL
jgi:hypothetical protein